jgi:hypothetical protein
LLLAFWAGPLTRADADSPAWHAGAGFRWRALAVPKTGKTGFTRLEAAACGITFTNFVADERGIANRNLLNGSGVAAGDVDGDGRCDLFFAGLGRCALYRNLGNWKFVDITEAAGVACAGQDSSGATFADIDGDGDLDLIVNSLGHGIRIFQNDGKGHFKEITEAAGVASKTGGTSLTLADVDGNGTLDLYVVNYRTTTVMDQPKTRFTFRPVNGKPMVESVNGVPATDPEFTNRFELTPTGDVHELGEADVLYLNDGQGHFTAASWTDGRFLDEDGHPLADAPRDWGLTAQFHDLNGDGAPDLYVCNDLWTPDRVWINDGHGHFRALPRLALRTTSTFSMGVDFADINRDGAVDFFVVDMLATGHKDRHTQVSQTLPIPETIGVFDNRPQVWRNTLQLNCGDTTFAEISFYAGVEASNWSWMPLFLDVDLDGYEDILISNGQMRDFQNVDMQNRINLARANRPLTAADIQRMVKMFPRFLTPGIAFRNHGDCTFEEVGAAWGWNAVGSSQGTAVADLDGDGDLDVIVNRLNDAPGLFRNDTVAPRLAVRLQGRPGNTQGIGAKIVVKGGPVEQSQEVICGGHYLSGADPLRTFAAGSLDRDLTIEVTWRSGQRSIVTGARGNRLYEIDEAGAQPVSPSPTVKPKPFFEDVSSLIAHRHHDDPFNDFERQPLLPNRLSQLGPGVAWHDLDGDGWEDLIVGTGRGGRLAVFHNDGHGGFTPVNEPMLDRPAPRDQTTVLGIGSTLFIGASNYEDGTTNGGCLRIYDFQRHLSGDSVLGQLSSAGPLALADVDGNGLLDLFIGGRVIPGRYPEPATSLLLRNEGGRFVIAQRFEQLGLVSGAVFSDLDGDGRPDLVLACDWGPLRIFHNAAGKLVEWNPPVTFRDPALNSQLQSQSLTLNQLTGWWNGVTVGDFDGDGRMDIAASNWGLNNRFRRDLSREHPRRLYYGDLGERGTVDLVEAVFDPAMREEVPARNFVAVSEALPFVAEPIPDFETYATSSLAQIYGDRLARLARLEVNTLASMVFLNRGDHFEAVELPLEAQLAPAFGVCAGDFDGDGREDLFLSQNFFDTTLDYTRYDAGRSLWLRGDGQGGFRAVPGQESGVEVYGEQRGCAVADYDHDGRLDLVVTQNGAETKLYHNRGAKPGLLVHLRGPAGNPDAVGAALRLGDATRLGPAREIHAGSGYWSTDGATQVMTLAGGVPTRLVVRWPGGATTTSELPAGVNEIAVRPDGNVIRLK